ncbi:MAG: hypothetical protein AB9842_05770 [Bacteroidales bacterium]
MKKLHSISLITGIFILPESLYAGSGNASDGLIFSGVVISLLSLLVLILHLWDYQKKHPGCLRAAIVNFSGKLMIMMHRLSRRMHKSEEKENSRDILYV